MRHRTVAIFGGEDDPQVLAVGAALRARGVEPTVLRLVPDELAGWSWGLDHLRRADGGDLASLAAVYVRGVPAIVPRHPTSVVTERERSEWEALAERGRKWHGVARAAQLHLEALGVEMVNPAACFWFHRSKPAADLRVQAAGVRVPASVVTSDPDVAHAFVDEFAGEVVFKPVAGGGACRVASHELIEERSAELRRAPVLFQERCRGRDLRIYTVDGVVVGSAVIHTENVDYRGHETGVEPVEIPDDVATIAGRAADALGMVFAGIDVKDPGTGEYTVLDVNPSPMFASLSEMAGIDIAGALASRLAAGSAR